MHEQLHPAREAETVRCLPSLLPYSVKPRTGAWHVLIHPLRARRFCLAKFKLTVPIDGSAIPGIDKGHPLKVAAIDAKGNVVSQVVRLEGGKAVATLSFAAQPEGLRVLVGPQ